ncbi:MAG: hypothetical protein JKY49_04805 [Cohaesibacteraceae bacterium]|nr:hypothetical protein [Cohaesibacteraceae bacterium]MBL4876111.1 hypothetical protein [Cohaesibacteraceae bacterium]
MSSSIWMVPTVWMGVHYRTRTLIEVGEAFLKDAFGADYVDYKTRVRHWLWYRHRALHYPGPRQ